MDLSQYAELFLAESREHLSACNQLLLEWERTPAARQPVEGIFRAIHTIKGMAATMGYVRVADLAHRMENLLERLRKAGAPPSDAILQLLFRATDALEKAVDLSVGGRERQVEVAALGEELDSAAEGSVGLEQSERVATRRKKTPRSEQQVREPARRARAPRSSPAAPPESVELPVQGGRLVEIALRAEAPLKGGRALLVLRRAQALGAVQGVTPPMSAFEAEDFDGRFSFRLDSQAPAADIERALEAAGDVERVAVGEDEARPASADALEGAKTRHIRVDLRRLDALMNQIGELVTVRGRLNGLAAERRDAALDDVAIQVARLSSDLQAEIIQARMTPVWQVFDRFPRLVRDLARQLGKSVHLRVEGKEIELDRAILDELGDPLLHLLRNAVDHGIERPEARQRAGKPPEGEIVLAAVRERGSIAITIADDGRGIDRQAVLARARREGTVDAGAEDIGDDQLLRIVARPGFSTASAVTSVSGRGVGIDVAMTRIRALGGTIDLRTDVGKGTTFVLRLPPTLAIVRALFASVGNERYALPLNYVAETVEFGQAPKTTVEGREAMVLRDRVVPLVDLRRLLGAGEPADEDRAKRPVIVLEMGERRAGVVVDRMLGQQEIVVKSFDAPRGTLKVFSGATILGDGIPALILDAGGLL
jgi:two-component system chemotaxis sensor kinase CheA